MKRELASDYYHQRKVILGFLLSTQPTVIGDRTVGYGDIIPKGRWAMVLANFEAMAGAIF
jgi:hypothetical protein